MKWFKEYDCCIECGTTERSHQGRGLCVNCYARKWRRENPETVRVTRRRYNESEHGKQKRREYEQRPETKQKGLEKARKYREKNREIMLERTRLWRAKNPSKIKEYNDRRRNLKWYRKYGENALNLLIETNYSCQKCTSENRVAVHHKDWDPKNNEKDNLAILCNSCHSTLHTFVPKRFRLEIFEGWMVS